MTVRTAEIKLTVKLDEDNLPTQIEWEASDAVGEGMNQCQSMMLSLRNADTNTIAVIDLWTKDTTVADMNLHFYQAFLKMADTYLRATKNSEIARSIHEFGTGFGENLGLT